MYIYDALIIYLAAGSPFAVLKAFQTGRRSGRAASILLAAAELIVWLPKLAILITQKAISDVKKLSPDSIKVLDAEITREVDRFYSFYIGRPNKFSRLARLLEDYVALGFALAPESGSMHGDLFSAAGRDDIDLAARCLDRRNRSKIAFHFGRTSYALSEEIAKEIESGNLKTDAIYPIRSIANAFADSNLANLSTARCVESKHAA